MDGSGSIGPPAQGGVGPGSGGGSGGLQRSVEPEALRRLAHRLEDEVDGQLAVAEGELGAVRDIEHDLFTSVTFGVASAYVLAVEFAEESLETKRQQVRDLCERLLVTAARWEATEARNTLTSDLGPTPTWW